MTSKKPDASLIARYLPYYEELEGGRTYLWCRCGRSSTQPFCDGSHRGTGLSPVRYQARMAGEEVLFCGCKRTCAEPFCDGSHNNLKSDYELDDPLSPENQAIPMVTRDSEGKVRLDGGCFVGSVPGAESEVRGCLRIAPIITSADGALYQSHFYLEVSTGCSEPMTVGDRHVILLVKSGAGTIVISGKRFRISSNQGVYVRPNEAFQVENDSESELRMHASVCPLADSIKWSQPMLKNFDDSSPVRVVAIDTQLREQMADRFFQMLVDKRIGSDVATQFIGEIPLGKAIPHRHLYEESLVILKGSGVMWTQNRRAAVEEGDVIFLPCKELHSLECTDPAGLFVSGVIYPGDNPTINY